MAWLPASVVIGLVLAASLAAPARAEEPAAPGPGTLDLSIRARALGIVPEPHAASTLDLEPMRAPLGEGTSRMPRAATGRERGLSLGVVVCDPDGVERWYMVRVDQPGTLPEGPTREGVRGLVLPGRPIP